MGSILLFIFALNYFCWLFVKKPIFSSLFQGFFLLAFCKKPIFGSLFFKKRKATRKKFSSPPS
jgi:hypothetical protein